MDKLSRRNLISGAGAMALSATSFMPKMASAAPTIWPKIGYDRIWVRNTNGEKLFVKHWNGRSYDQGAVKLLSWLWRDWRDQDTAVYIDPRLFTYLANIQTELSLLARSPRMIILNSGFRTKRRNSTLEGAAPNSEHIKGKAADFRIEGVRPSDVHKMASSLNVNGLGKYTNFTHIDVGRAGRRWYG